MQFFHVHKSTLYGVPGTYIIPHCMGYWAGSGTGLAVVLAVVLGWQWYWAGSGTGLVVVLGW